ncbi:transposase family protein [Brachybacterium alimentarium]|uniref:transposase family protein n=1 Tax=Brachybacterium alimentarium TaxID=47845 RepID=UPI0015CAF6B8
MARCRSCGAIATGHGRIMVETTDGPWAGRPVLIRWRKRRWVCREDLCPVVSFVEQDPAICLPRGLLSVRAIRWATGQFC